ncbi:rhodanese-like domain-containing protein [Halobacillus litoralis]|uniref:Rhodanese-like domain-containing protein n=1 Tax=Halobacillus litoralis TaxID=45668 RepID=A0A845DUK6_9BACI|nr:MULTISPECIES: rhodanese-like domain-containing protein [Halobacillus]MCA1023956.1 rhodanese-like domain-containing protein [Halobacillus litoralis]MYL21180.1 rhodanese-like domain-containing protein [Halobacillus litoralis]MYL31286.1 rhodanese-like domain-containing protein [Halobacillus halophilus]MYL38562.1 rhodanese-like domain-containing protein [Halobacillus litoralis]
MEFVYGSAILLFLTTLFYYARKSSPKPYFTQSASGEDVCVIDIRDYIIAHRSPYPGAENIPLNYLPRALKERFDCTKDILVISDNKRAARMAARMIRKKKRNAVYYMQPE